MTEEVVLNDDVSLETASNQIITIVQFEQIKKAVLRYLLQSKLERRELFISELQKGQSVLNAELAWQHGAWRLEKHLECFALVRYPQRSQVMYFFVAYLKNTGDSWQIESFKMEKMWGR